ncbi:MAG: MBL fold metallo-hydrolase [Rhabdochlamydiaceae bacterium]|nr:MBL fold metallo-hydrolase [Rhabdochlamydiaceae bacterium]
MDFFEKSTFRNGRFISIPEGKSKTLADVIKWKWTSEPKAWPKWRHLSALPLQEIDANQNSATWISHSTVLLKIHGQTILTDPVFSNRIGPHPWLGIKRKTPPGKTIESLPPIDIILISHNHYDHLDAFSIKAILSSNNPLVIAPLGNGTLLRSLGCTRVIELDWWDSFQATPLLNIALTPALHWSRRTLWDTCQALWGGFVIQSPPLKIFFAGDTGYHDHFQKIHQKFGPMDFSLLPIGAYEPKWFMKDAHMDPADAIQAHLDLHSKQSMGIHFGTFRLTDEGIDDPVDELKMVLVKAKVDPLSFTAPLLGQTITI